MYVMKANGTVVYDQSQPGIWSVKSPKYSLALNEAGELQFFLVPNDSFYYNCKPMETYISLEDDGEEVFYGRVLTRSRPVMKGQVTITCEGALAFLLDAELAADSKSGSSYNHQTQTAEAFISRCITAYNDDITLNGTVDAKRELSVGTMAHSKKSETKEYKITSYTDIKSVIENQILDEYGGFIQIRNQNGSHVFDWMEGFDSIDEKPIALTQNIIDQTNKVSGENIFTVLRPIGKDGLTLSEDTLNVFSSSDIENKYGRIVKSVTFSDKSTEAALRTRANEYIALLHGKMFANAEIKLVDFHYIDGTFPKIRLGDSYSNLTGFEGETLTVATIERDCENPANDVLTLKNGKEMEALYKGTGTDNDSSSSSSSGSSSGVSLSGTTYKYIKEGEEMLQLHTKDININAENLVMTANNITALSRRTDTLEGKVRDIEGSGLFLDEEQILAVSGKFQIDENGNVILESGAQFTVSGQDGANIVVGERISELDSFVNSYKGTAIYGHEDEAGMLAGSFTVDTTGGSKRIILENGAGLFVTENGVEQGVYTQGNLDGGIIIQKINGGSGSSVAISGDKISLVGNDQYSEISLTVGTMGDTVTDLDGKVNTDILGSTFWQTKENISSVVGEFEYQVDEFGNTNLVVKNGAAFKLARNSAVFGLYDEGNLDGGLVIAKIGTASNGDQQTLATLLATKINIQASQVAQFGARVRDEAGQLSEVQFIADVMAEDPTAIIKATNLNLDGVQFINLINQDEDSGTTINAGKLNLDGYVTSNWLRTQGAIFGTETTFTRSVVAQAGISIGADGLEMANNSNAYMANVYADSLYLGPNDADMLDAIVSAEVSLDGSTLTLTSARGDVVNFSKAGSGGWNGVWSGRIFMVSSSASGNNKSGIVYDGIVPVYGTRTWAKVSGSYYARMTYNVYSEDDNGDADQIILSKQISIAADEIYDEGRNAVIAGTPTWPSGSDSDYERSMRVSTVGRADQEIYTDYSMALGNINDNAVELKMNNVRRLTFTHNKYNAGWISAYGESYAPTTPQTTNAYMTVRRPSSVATASQKYTEYTYYLDATTSNNVAYIRYGNSESGNVVAQVTHNKYTNGKNAVNFSTAAWSKTGNDADSTNSFVVTLNNNQNPGSWGVNLSKGSWSSDHKLDVFLKTGLTSGSGTTIGKIQVVATSRYNAGYNNGWGQARTRLSIPTTANTSTNLLTIGYPPSTVDGDQATAKYYLDATTSDDVAYVRYNNGSTGTIVAQQTHGKYTAGKNYVTVAAPTWAGSDTAVSRSMTVSTSGRPTASTLSYTMTLVNADDNTVILNQGSTKRLTLAHNKYNAGYNNGWGQARTRLSVPTGANTSTNLLTIGYPPSTVDGDQATAKYYLDATTSDDVAYVRYNNGSTGTIVAQQTHGKYTAGKNYVTVAAPTWAGSDAAVSRSMTVSTSGRPTASTLSYTMTLVNADDNTVILNQGSTKRLTLAHNKYKAGYEAGWRAYHAGVVSYWWAGEETSASTGHQWWDVAIPKADAWQWAYDGTYAAKRQASWTNVGEYWDDACFDISAHTITPVNPTVNAGSLNYLPSSTAQAGIDAFINGCTQLFSPGYVVNGYYYKFQITASANGKSTYKWYYFRAG